ncbi:MAG: tautomerase PptA [Treponema sp.]|jgi:4-oxalocrotonate tautomerase|nr:tautomerase PptA [Treponema sp.]
MLHVEIKCFPGRTEEQKKACAEKIAQALIHTMGCNNASISIAIKEVAEKDWKSEVWDKSIVAEKEFLIKHPDYVCE